MNEVIYVELKRPKKNNKVITLHDYKCYLLILAERFSKGNNIKEFIELAKFNVELLELEFQSKGRNLKRQNH